jgi:hypothetical protein
MNNPQTLYQWLPPPLRHSAKLWPHFHQPVIYAPKRLHPNPLTTFDSSKKNRADKWCVIPGCYVIAVGKTNHYIARLTPAMAWEFCVPFEVFIKRPKQCRIDTLPIVDIATPHL